MEKTRRVGTFSLGVILLLFGILFLLRIIIPSLSYLFIMQLWPCVLISLGIEILVSLIGNKNINFKYDFAAIVLIGMVSVFAMLMAAADFVIANRQMYINW